MRMMLVAGSTETARIDGISAAGATPMLAAHTPAADAEILCYGRPVSAPVTPVSPAGCPTPAAITRAVRELCPFPVTVLDAGMATPTAAPTVSFGHDPGADVRDPVTVPVAAELYADARRFGSTLPDAEIVIAETIPGGTTTAAGVLAALGEPYGVSSSLAAHPVELKGAVVEKGLAASSLTTGTLDDPLEAIRLMGDPVLAVATGLVHGAHEAGIRTILAGGTQLLTVAILSRRLGVDGPLTLATTPFVLADEHADVPVAATVHRVVVVATDPGFDPDGHPSMAAYARGTAKEGVGMGGALWHAARADLPMAAVRDRVVALTEELIDDG